MGNQTEQANQEAIASKIDRLEDVLLFLRLVSETITEANDIGPGGFAELIGYKNFMGFGNTDLSPPLTRQEERFMGRGLIACAYHERVRNAPHIPINLDDSILAASRGVFQVGKQKCSSAIFAACAIFRFWSMANDANCFNRWHREKNLNPAEQPAGVNLTPPQGQVSEMPVVHCPPETRTGSVRSRSNSHGWPVGACRYQAGTPKHFVQNSRHQRRKAHDNE